MDAIDRYKDFRAHSRAGLDISAFRDTYSQPISANSSWPGTAPGILFHVRLRKSNIYELKDQHLLYPLVDEFFYQEILQEILNPFEGTGRTGCKHIPFNSYSPPYCIRAIH